MKKQALRAIAIFILIASIILISLITASIVTQMEEERANEIKYLYNKMQSCTVDNPKERTIVIRMDDVGALENYEASKEITGIALEHDKAIVLGVIPSKLEENTISWLKSISSNNKVEIALHGYKHENYEFKDLNAIDAKNKIYSGIKRLYSKLGIIPATFIPPNNQYSESTAAALHEAGIKIISAKQAEYAFGSHPARIGYTITTFRLENGFFVPATKIISDCKDSLDRRNMCVILIHPQDYRLKGTSEINPIGKAELISTLEQLGSLNAEYKTFKGIMNCQD